MCEGQGQRRPMAIPVPDDGPLDLHLGRFVCVYAVHALRYAGILRRIDYAHGVLELHCTHLDQKRVLSIGLSQIVSIEHTRNVGEGWPT